VSVEEPLPQLVRSRVAFARRGLMSVRLLQAGMLATTAVTLALAACVHGGGRLGAPGPWIVALANGALVFFTWALACRRSESEVARSIDVALDEDGALFTAWEVEGRSSASELARRLGEEVAAATRPRGMLRAILPATTPLLALPFVGCALLFAALEGAREERSQVDLAELVRQVEAGLGSLSDQQSGMEGETLTPEERHDLGQLLRQAASKGRALDEDPSSEELAELDQELESLAGELPEGEVGEAMRAELDRARAALDAARMAMESEAEDAQDGPGGGGATGGDGDSGGGSTKGGTPSLARDEAIGRIPRSDSPGGAPPSRAEAGVLGLPTWPEAYDGLVRRWVEFERTTD